MQSYLTSTSKREILAKQYTYIPDWKNIVRKKVQMFNDMTQ